MEIFLDMVRNSFRMEILLFEF